MAGRLKISRRLACKLRNELGLPAHWHQSVSYQRKARNRPDASQRARTAQRVQAIRAGWPGAPGPGCAAVLQVMADVAGASRFTSADWLAMSMGLHASTVHSHLRDLVELGFVGWEWRQPMQMQIRKGSRKYKVYYLTGKA